LPASVVDATSKRYLEAYRRITGADLDVTSS
jgi:phosphoribosylaminoimidazole-succinocarboxamide synthase